MKPYILIFIFVFLKSTSFSLDNTKKNEFKFIRYTYFYDTLMNNYRSELMNYSYKFHVDSIFIEKVDTEITIFPSNNNLIGISEKEIDTLIFTDEVFLGKIIVNSKNFNFISNTGDTSIIFNKNNNTNKFNRKLNPIYASGEIEFEKDTSIKINSVQFNCIKLKIKPKYFSHKPIELIYEFIDKKSLLPILVLFYHHGMYLIAKDQLINLN
jgi:hypothetical protein